MRRFCLARLPPSLPCFATLRGSTPDCIPTTGHFDVVLSEARGIANSARERDGLLTLSIALARVLPFRILAEFNGSASAAFNCDDDVFWP
jgi:hypothetical protein